MAQIPQINNPITAKNYNYSPRQQDENTEPFDVVRLTGANAAGGSGDAGKRGRLEMGNRDLIPLSVQIAKDPTMAVETLKDLLNVEVLNQALITGHTELYGGLENLAKELYVTPEQLVQEIQNQEQQNTMFSGHEFYDVLREVAQTTTDPETKELIGNLLKSLNFAQNKSEILGALRANMKFLSDYYAPNEKLSAKLLNLSQQWGAQDADKYFDYLKGETLNILKDVSGSLLNDDKTQMLIPLIVHNLSRYNNSPYMCKEYFNLLLTQISSGTLRESLKNSFNRLFSAIFDKQPMQDPGGSHEVPAQTQNVQPQQTFPFTDDVGEDVSDINDMPMIGQPDHADNVDPDGGAGVRENFGGDGYELSEEALTGKEVSADIQAAQRENPDAVSDENPVSDISRNQGGDGENLRADNPIDNYTTNLQQNQPLSANQNDKNLNFKEVNDDIRQNDVNSEENFVDNPEDEPDVLTGYRKNLFESMSEKGYMNRLKQSGYNIERTMNNYIRGKIGGMDAVKTLTKGLFISDRSGENTAELMNDLSKINTMQELIDKLNEMLRAMPDIPIRERLYGSFVDIIDRMSVKNELPQHGVRPPVSSTLDSLTDFIQENINHPALKSLDSFNASNLLQSLLNAPGVFTPLAHYILPLDVDGTKAFGELWVDNDENNPNNTPSTQRNYHLFLTFDVESIGRFELDMYALGEDVNIALLYPNRFENQIEPMKQRINKIIRNIGYNAKTFETAPLKKPHNLPDIFPKILDRRTSLNKRV
ncbi:MAG: hypothetical protein K2O14_13640 [Oscillospiraceae bacterium]|nr:hypothetical protein [Oscillospiraceae bacterium]